MQPHEVIIRPIITEKAMRLADEENKYTFEVHPKANKIEIRRAVEALFDVRVTKVNVIRVRGKARAYGRVRGRTRSWKKAIVTLAPGDRIQIFEGV